MESANRKPPPASKLDAQDAVELIERLINLHIQIQNPINIFNVPCLQEDAELVRRRLTDYLLATDPRPGLYFKGPKD